MSILTPLTTSQQEAVDCNDMAVLVLAGPGSGKTHILTRRIARIIEETAERHFKVLGLTFTNKAAIQMQERVESMVPDAGGRMHLTTFHSFGASLLRQHGFHVGIRPDFTILTQPAERMMVLKEAVRRAGAPAYTAAASLLSLVTRLIEQDVRPEGATKFLRERHIENAGHIGPVYENYRRIMVENNELDYGGLVAEALRLLRAVPAVQSLINAVYPHVCVDEFQDTNLAQYGLLREIVNPSTTRLFAVADDDQIIYQWNGADPKWLASLRKDFDCRVLELPVSYRCPPEIIGIANRLISHNSSHDGGRAALVSHKQDGTECAVSVRMLDSGAEESDWIAGDIVRQSPERRRGCAVLGRNRAVLKSIAEGLERRGVPYHLPVRKDEFVSKPMAWLHAMLCLANVRQSRDQLNRVCMSFLPLGGVRLIVDDIICDSLADDGHHLRAWLRAALRQQLNGQTRSFLEGAVPCLVDRLDFRTFVQKSFEWFAQLPAGVTDTEEYRDETDAWDLLATHTDNKLGPEQVTLAALLQEIDLQPKTAPAPQDSVPCYTVHASKGLEFDHVYLAGLVEGEMPDRRAMAEGDGSAEMQEERRVCFVAITRARQKLTLTCARRMFGQQCRPSRFLSEMGLGDGDTNQGS
ncbi:MAG: ATP-dependent helicase [Nitrosopumilaceae archaeon]|nr:ATP-dependent helicase [Nitrosopumilaceae archaeon]